MGDSSKLDEIVRSTSEELSSRFQAIYKSKDISIDQPTPLGALFQIPDAYAFAMIVPVSSEGATVRTIGTSVLLRVRNRLLFAYIYGSADETSLKWIQTTAEQWTHETLAANSK
jgi:hypothetical protein